MRIAKLWLGTMRIYYLRLGTMRIGTLRVGTLRLGTLRIGTLIIGTMRLGTMRLGKSGSNQSKCIHNDINFHSVYVLYKFNWWVWRNLHF